MYCRLMYIGMIVGLLVLIIGLYMYCRLMYIGMIVGLLVFLIMDVFHDVRRLTSFFGIVTFVTLSYVTSKNPAKVCV